MAYCGEIWEKISETNSGLDKNIQKGTAGLAFFRRYPVTEDKSWRMK
jgi:hypothetical protein